MSCRKVRRLLSSYLDEEATTRERVMVGMHLSRCSECRRLFSQMRGMRLVLLATPRLPAAEEFSRGWRERLRQKGDPSPSPRRPGFLVPALAGLALLAAAFLFLRPWALPPALELGTLKRAPGLEKAAGPSPPASPDSVEGGEEAEPSPAAGGAPREKEAAVSPGKGPAVPRISKSVPVEKASPPGGEEAAPPAASLPEVPAAAEEVAGGETPADSPAKPLMKEGEDGSWRVWLLAVGPRPMELRRVLVEKGLLQPGQEEMVLAVPLLLCRGLSHDEARELSVRIEEAGGRARIEALSP